MLERPDSRPNEVVQTASSDQDVIVVPVPTRAARNERLPARNSKMAKLRNCVVPTVLWSCAITNALYQSASTGTTLNAMNYSLAFVIPTSMLIFISNMNLSNKFSIDGADEILAILEHGHPDDPNEWPKISKWREALAITGTTFATIPACYIYGGGFYNTVKFLPQTYHYAQTIAPYMTYVNIGEYCGSVIVAGNTVVGYGRVCWKYMRKFLSNQKIEFANNFSRVYSIPFTASSIFYTIANGLSNLSSFPDYSSPAIWVNGSLLLPTAIGDFSMNGRFAIDSVDQLVGYLSSHLPTASESGAFFFATAFATTAAYVQYVTTENSLQGLASGLKIDAPDIINPIIAGLCLFYAFSGGIIDIATFLPLLTSFQKQLSTFAHAVATACCAPAEEIDVEATRPLTSDMDPPAESIATNANTLFASRPIHSINHDQDEPTVNPRSKRCGCNIL